MLLETFISKSSGRLEDMAFMLPAGTPSKVLLKATYLKLGYTQTIDKGLSSMVWEIKTWFVYSKYVYQGWFRC